MNIAAIMLVFVAQASLLMGQSGDGAKPGADDIPLSLVDENAAGARKQGRNFLRRKAGEPIADNAEAAEDFDQSSDKSDRIWIRAEFMLWRLKVANVPPLVTSGAFSDPLPGALSSPNTNILFGGSGLDYQDRSGGRFAVGSWLDDELHWGFEASYFFLAGRPITFGVSSPGNPVLAVPFFNVNTGAADSSLVTYPGVMSGRIALDAPSFLQSAEANLIAVLWHTPHFHVEAIAGFRYVGLNEGLHLQQSSLVDLAPQYVGLVPFNGNTIVIGDYFDTRNQFYGGQIGARAEFLYKRCSLSISAKVALGASNEIVAIRGTTTIDTQPATTANAGLLAVSSNSGSFSRNTFAVVPEVGLNFGYQLTDHIRMIAGYNFLYWSSVVRPGDQIDTAINPNLVPSSNTFGAAGGQARPAFSFRSTDFFAHGVNLGVEFRY